MFEVNGSLLWDKQVAALETGMSSILWLHDLAVSCLSHKNYFFYYCSESSEVISVNGKLFEQWISIKGSVKLKNETNSLAEHTHTHKKQHYQKSWLQFVPSNVRMFTEKVFVFEYKKDELLDRTN